MRDIVVYTCNVCDRTTQLQRNRFGLETVGGCIITKNCRGKLYISDILKTTTPFLSTTEEVFGLENFSPRRKLSNFSQQFEQKVWYISHNLNAFPVITVYGVDKEIIPDTEFSVKLIDKNTISLTFRRSVAGTAQMYVREVSNIVPIAQDSSVISNNKTQISTSLIHGTIAFLTKEPRNNDVVALNITTPTGGVERATLELSNINSNSPWNGIRSVIIRNKMYYVGIANFFASGFNTALIASGTTISFNEENSSSEITHILLANSPFDRADIIRSQIIERVMVDKNPNSLFFDNDEIFCNNEIINTVYPELTIS